MRQPLRTASAAKILGAAVLLLAFGGCSADDIELNGGLFDAVGMGSKNRVAKSEPVMAARAPLVLPPNLERLPQPGAPVGGESADVAALDDPDKKLIVDQAALEREQAEYCKVNYEQKLAHGDRTSADLAEGPLGPCRGSAMGLVNLIKGGAQ